MPPKPAAAIYLLENGRWAYAVDGRIKFVSYSYEECMARAAIQFGQKPTRDQQDAALGRL